MSVTTTSAQTEPGRRATALGLTVVAVVFITLAMSWTSLGATFYRRAVPFYDSLAYQESFVSTANDSATRGAWPATVRAWNDGGITAVAYRLFAAVFGNKIADGREGLYLYLNTAHLLGMAALVYATWCASGSLALGAWALAAWLSAVPFTQAVSGVLDQRMDLASGSLCLAVAALALAWSRRPAAALALATGAVASAAVLHRPVMVVTVVAILAIFAVRAVLRCRQSARFWCFQSAAMVGPILLLALPWMIVHREQLYQYYVARNVDVGSAASWREAASYNLPSFLGHVGSRYGWMILAGAVWASIFRRIDWLDTLAVLLATAVPLISLIASRSVGNFIVCQVAIGIPALMLACTRPRGHGRWAAHPAWLVVACAGLIWSEVHSLKSLRYQVANRSPEIRMQTAHAVAEIASANLGTGQRLAGFQAAPLDPLAFSVIARELGVSLDAGSRLFHPGDFGLGNAALQGISRDQMRAAVAQALENIRASDTLLMVPVAGAQLPGVPFSHTQMDVIREVVASNPAFTRLLTTRPIDGVAFDFFKIKRRD